MTLPDVCSISQMLSQSGRGFGERFMKKNGALGAVRVALHDHRAVVDVREEDVGATSA